jgi:hypothetical protein
MRKAMAWESIVKDERLQRQMTQAQATDAKDKAKTHGDGAVRAVRAAWSHVFTAIKSETPGKPFDLEHALISSRERGAIPVFVYDKAKADGVVLEKLGTERLWKALEPIWPADRSHLPLAEVVDWFATYVYLPKLRDRVVLETAIRDSVAKLDPQFGFADGFDEAAGRYRNLVWARNPPDLLPAAAVLVRAAEALVQVAESKAKATAALPARTGEERLPGATGTGKPETGVGTPDAPACKPRRF